MPLKLLPRTRYLVILAVAGALLASVAVLVYGLVEAAAAVWHLAASGEVSREAAKGLALAMIELVDLLLLGTVFYIIALGLYELFIDDRLPLPHWLEIHDLDDLKAKLIGVVVPVLGVSFLGQVLSWDGERDLSRLGFGIALVVAALTWFLSRKPKKSRTRENGEGE